MVQKWEREAKAEKLLQRHLAAYCAENSRIKTLQENLHSQTSTRLFDWVDHYVIQENESNRQDLEDCGFQLREDGSYRHPGAVLPPVLLRKRDLGLAVSVEHLSDFLQSHGITAAVEGSTYSGFRRCLVNCENAVCFWAAERRGILSFEPTTEPASYLQAYFEASEKWLTRPRGLDDEAEAMQLTLQIAQELADSVGPDLAAWIVLEGERRYWQSRNTAGHLQKGRQDRLGMGWANHDHHTFRSSRKLFKELVQLFEILGFHCRERFYAGEQAGWGAQVMENSNCGIVLFLDLDLAPHELDIDFAHEQLEELEQLGTIGLWCRLHGDSILKAGMHHLEAQFDFEGLTKDLHGLGIGMMAPFSDFPYLKQAFTQGEVWKVDPKRVAKLQAEGLIAQSDADGFLKNGAIGSHLENLERNEGYKGFNQKNVSYIIAETDPRKQTANVE